MLFRAAAELALEQGLTERAGTALGNLSDLAFGHDRYEDALGYLEQSRHRALGHEARRRDASSQWGSGCNDEAVDPLHRVSAVE